MMNVRRLRTIVAKILLVVSYLTLILQWLWLLLIVVPPLVKSGAIDALYAPTQPAPNMHTETFVASPIVLVIIGVITLAILIGTVIILIRIPKAIVQTGERVVEQTAQAVLPTLTHHKPVSATKKRVLSRRIKLAIQLVAVALPVLVSFFLPPLKEISTDIIVTLALILACVSLIGFVTAWLIAPPVKTKTTSRIRSRASRG